MINGISWNIEQAAGDSPFLHVRSEAPLRTLNTSIWGGGFGYHRSLVNRHVNKNYSSDDPGAEARQFLAEHGIPPEDACAMLTAAYVEDYGYSEHAHTWEDYGESFTLRVAAWVTAGLGNAARAGEQQPVDRLYPGTVNTILAIDARLTDAAMAGALITATEAKAALFQDLDIRAYGSHRQATGTTTDAILIGATGRSHRDFLYAGSATVLGHLIGRTVYEAAYASCSRYLELYPPKPAEIKS